MTVAIRFDNVSKKFKLHHQRARSIQEVLVSLTHRTPKVMEERELWILKNVSFQIEKGESVAFVGPNGTGKSTSLKLISGILFPNTGMIEVNGRIGALLELGAGFHIDLTGRENIYLNGSVLGLSRSQIEQRMAAIIEFSELEKFIDIPVKHYSSGMYMRLGFSIAVHTDPDILLVDEVLAVGDATFQRKCIERIAQLKQQGVTILFVSHDVTAIRRICDRAIWMEKGEILADAETENVIQRYLWHAFEKNKIQKAQNHNRWGSGEVKITGVTFLDADGQPQTNFYPGQPFTIQINYRASQKIEKPVFGLAIHRSDGIHITGPNTKFSGRQIDAIQGEGSIRYSVGKIPLLEGVYYVSVAVHDWTDTKMFDYHDKMYPFYILSSEKERYGMITLYGEWYVK